MELTLVLVLFSLLVGVRLFEMLSLLLLRRHIQRYLATRELLSGALNRGAHPLAARLRTQLLVLERKFPAALANEMARETQALFD